MTLTLGILLFCQGWDYYARVELPWKNWLCLLAGMAGLALLAGGTWLIMKPTRNARHRLWVMGGVSVLSAVLIFYCSAHYGFTPGWDPAFVRQDMYNLANGFTEDLSHEYFSYYPNNLLLTIFFSWLYRLAAPLGMRGQEYFLIHGFQCAGFGLVLFLIYLCSEKLLDGKRPDISLWCWVTGFLLVGISPWVAVQYTDAAAMILVAVETWLFLKAREGRHRPLWVGLLFFLGAVAFRVKPQTLILLIAAVLMRLLGEGKEIFSAKNLRRTAASACALVLGAGLGISLNAWAYHGSGYHLNPEAQFGISHYLKMGLNETEMGGYAEEDVRSSEVAPNRAERDRVNWEIISERVSTMGIPGLWKQAVRKTLTNYGDGTFGWEQEGMFYSYDSYYFKGGNRWFFEHVPPFYISAEYGEMVDESYSHVWRILCQCIWMGTLLLGIFSYGRKTEHRVGTLQLAILGLTLFELLFEARARYLFGYAPVYVMLAGVGLAGLTGRMFRREPAFLDKAEGGE